MEPVNLYRSTSEGRNQFLSSYCRAPLCEIEGAITFHRRNPPYLPVGIYQIPVPQLSGGAHRLTEAAHLWSFCFCSPTCSFIVKYLARVRDHRFITVIFLHTALTLLN